MEVLQFVILYMTSDMWIHQLKHNYIVVTKPVNAVDSVDVDGKNRN